MEVKLVNLLSLILIKIKNYIDYTTKEKIDIIIYSYNKYIQFKYKGKEECLNTQKEKLSKTNFRIL